MRECERVGRRGASESSDTEGDFLFRSGMYLSNSGYAAASSIPSDAMSGGGGPAAKRKVLLPFDNRIRSRNYRCGRSTPS